VTRRAPSPALLTWERKGLMRLGLLAHYDRDAGFNTALADLPKLSELDAEIAAEEVSRNFGLDRLQASDGFPNGVDLIRRWVDRQREGRPGRFLNGATFGGYRPHVGELMSRQVDHVDGPDGAKIAVVEEQHSPIIHVGPVNEPWDPSREPWSAARKRAHDQLDRQLDPERRRIEEEASGAGYEFGDTTTRQQEHLLWLFRRIRHRETYPEIAREAQLRGVHVLEDGVWKAVRAMAAQIGVDQTDL
jgi:hypothetical protein